MSAPSPLILVVHSGLVDKIHYALAIASTAAALNRPTTLFLTLGALPAFSCTAQAPGWHTMPISGEFTARGIADGAALDDAYRMRGIGGFEELLAACLALDVQFMVCDMGLRALALEGVALRSDLTAKPGGLASIMAQPAERLLV